MKKKQFMSSETEQPVLQFDCNGEEMDLVIDSKGDDEDIEDDSSEEEEKGVERFGGHEGMDFEMPGTF